MTHYHPIWEPPGPADLKAGMAAVEKAKSAGAKTQRERDYIAAIETFYKDARKMRRTQSDLNPDTIKDLAGTRSVLVAQPGINSGMPFKARIFTYSRRN